MKKNQLIGQASQKHLAPATDRKSRAIKPCRVSRSHIRSGMKYTKEDLDKFVQETFVDEAGIDGIAGKDELTAYFQENLFFITVTFRNASRFNIDLCHGEFRNFYFQFCRVTVGNHFQRKPALQPLTFYCLDEDGSRHQSVNLSEAKNPHIHALALVKPEISKKWRPESKNDILRKVHSISDIHIEKFDLGKSSLDSLISYTTKGLRRFQNNEIFYDFLPINLDGRQGSRMAWKQSWKNNKQPTVLIKPKVDRFKDFI